MLCPKCRKKIGKSGFKIICDGKCGDWYHLTCAGLGQEEMEKAKKRKIKWICDVCCDDSSSDENNDMSLLSGTGTQREKGEEPSKFIKRRSIAKLNDDNDVNMKALLEHINKKFSDLEISLNFTNEIMDDLRKCFHDLKEDNKLLRKENEIIKRQVAEIQKEVHLLKRKCSINEKEEKSRNVMIMGLQSKNDNECLHDVKNILRFLNADTEIKDFSVKIINSKTPYKPVLVKFQSPEQRNLVLAKRKEKGILESTDCNIPGEKRKLYINEDMDREIRLLFNQARSLKNHGFKYIWYKNGLVFGRKEDKSEVIVLKTSEQIEDLKA